MTFQEKKDYLKYNKEQAFLLYEKVTSTCANILQQ